MFRSMTDEHKQTFYKLVLIIILSFALSYFASRMMGMNRLILIIWFLILYLAASWDVIKEAITGLRHGQALDENFLMTLATVTAFLIGDYLEAISVMVFYGFGELFEDIATHKSKENIKGLLDLVPDLANKVLDDGSIEEIDLDDVEVGDILMVRDGEKVGVDGIITEGECLVDTSSVTGESMPVELGVGDEIISSSIVTQGIIKYEATKEFDDSVAAKIIELIEDSHMSKSDSERLITKFARIYTPIVVGFAAFLAIIPPLFLGREWSDYLLRAATFLVLSCPCALVLSVPLSFMSGLGLASKEGILIKGSQFFEELKAADILLTDKTGTLTTGEFRVKDVEFLSDYDKERALDYIYNIEKLSTHPIARGIVNSLDREENPDLFESVDNKSGLGVVAKSKIGEEIKLGSAKFLEIKEDTARAVYLGIDGNLVAKIHIEDEIKKDSAETVSYLKNYFKKIAVVSGDSKAAVKATSDELNLTDYYAELMPKDKLDAMDEFKKEGHKVVFVGDGINDAPVLKNATVGISMGESASDLAIESSDILIVNGEFSQLKKLMHITKLTNSTVIQNITFIMAVKIIILIMGFFGHASMWLAIFGDVGVSIIAILWAMRILKKRL